MDSDVNERNSEFVNKFPKLNENCKGVFNELDECRELIYNNLNKKINKAQKSIVQKSEDKKSNIERQLEKNEKQLSNLLWFGNELVTNIKVANDKNEFLRKNYETYYKKDLEAELEKENADSLARFHDITSKWVELDNITEPMSLFENLEKQKENVKDLMQSKDNIIEQCQKEINRISKKYYLDQEQQANDLCCLVERIDIQTELFKEAYNEHMNLLQNTIDNERENIIMNISTKWNSFYEIMFQNEDNKFQIAKKKEKFYAEEIKSISDKQEEITRSTRIRLEKDAELLEWELRNIKNNVLMNSEKLDYNYQVLQRRNEENVIINNQQKRRVAKLNEGVSMLKKKIQSSLINSENTMKKLSIDIQKLHSSISELEKKSQQFRKNNKTKFCRVWDINFKEIESLLKKVFEIDKILHEQQLTKAWTVPDIDLENINHFNASNPKKTVNSTDQPTTKANTTMQEKLAEIKLLRNIIRKISDRAGFLVEDKLLKILEPYTDEQSCLVRVDNIFTALRIKEIAVVTSLSEHFKPYAWCPNCKLQSPENNSQNQLFLGADKSSIVDESSSQQRIICNDHYLVIEPALVLTSLNNFTSQQFKRIRFHGDFEDNETKVLNLINIDNSTILRFWRKFSTYVPKNKQTLWAALEHGLNHYLKVLKLRMELDNECRSLKIQNDELKYLLQKFQF